MKNIFKGYYTLGDQELMDLWKNALFVFDTNILLDLYRYESKAREELFKVMENLADRVWIPYHVGLEYQINRLKAIAERQKEISEVKKTVQQSILISEIKKSFEDLENKNRHNINPHINPDELLGFLKSLEEIQQNFFEKLDELEEKGINVNSEDKIRDRIDALFMEKIGNKPENQKEIDEIFSEGEERYKNQIPPGFEDLSKESSDDEFTYAGLTYKREYGDLIIWKQIISYASENSVKNLVFVTNDQKVDWWWKIESDGPKTIGVRPELRDEISREAGVENFHIFNIGGFLHYANKQPNVKVTEETIKEVREVSDDRREMIMRSQMMRRLEPSAETAVYKWLSPRFSHLEQNRHRYLDLIGYRDDRKYGFEIRLVQSPRTVMFRLREMIYRCYYILNEEGFYEIAIIFVVLDEEIIPELRSLIRRGRWEVQRNLRIIIGKAEYSEEEGRMYDFTPYDDFNLGDHPG